MNGPGSLPTAPRTLSGRTALVTGSTSGIGAAIAYALAAEGAAVALNGYGDRAAIDALRERIERECGVRAVHFAADVADAGAVKEMMAAVGAALGPVDILVNSAGVNHLAPIDHFPVDEWQRVRGVHLDAAFHTMRIAVPSMKARGWGRIVNVASVYGLIGGAGRAAYSAAKHGLVGLTKVVALETAAFDITCNAVCPGLVRTPPVEREMKAEAMRSGRPYGDVLREMLDSRQPTGRLIEPDEVAALVVYLCQESSREIRGVALPMDGAWSAR